MTERVTPEQLRDFATRISSYAGGAAAVLNTAAETIEALEREVEELKKERDNHICHEPCMGPCCGGLP